MNLSKKYTKLAAISALAAVVVSSALITGCKNESKPVQFSVTVPSANVVQMDITMMRRFGFSMSGAFDILSYGSVYINGETAEHGLQFGFKLNTSAFLRESWTNYEEVTTLPGGTAFPAWMGGPVVELSIPPANTRFVDWNFYFGTRGQYYMGLAAFIHALDNRVPSLRFEYSYYDDQNRPIIGIVLFGPVLNSDGSVNVPGGVFVGTNITPFLPNSAISELAMKALKAGNGKKFKYNGQSYHADLKVSGKDANKYKTQRSLEKVLDVYMNATKLK